MINDAGRPKQVSSIVLSAIDGAQSISIKSGVTILEMAKRAPEDPIGCPFLSETRKYKLSGLRLVLSK